MGNAASSKNCHDGLDRGERNGSSWPRDIMWRVLSGGRDRPNNAADAQQVHPSPEEGDDCV